MPDPRRVGLQPVDPHSGKPLMFTALDPADRAGRHADLRMVTGTWQAGDGQVWPQIDGVPFLRARRETLADEAVTLLHQGRRAEALAQLLIDTDDFAASAPSREAAIGVVQDVDAGRCGAMEAMRRLAYGPVADYFAVRPSTPTFLSGIALLAGHVSAEDTVIELACGMGHLLSHLTRHDIACAGCDVTFSKLWLSRRFLLPNVVPLICADIVAGDHLAVSGPDRCSVLCHDAFYFLPDKPRAARRMQSLAGTDGQVLLGHVHLAGFDHGGIAGELHDAAGYADLFVGPCHLHDDADLVHEYTAGRPAARVTLADLQGREALALVAGRACDALPERALLREPAGELLYANPLLVASCALGDGPGSGERSRLQARWPSAAFAAEYRDTPYLGSIAPLDVGGLPRAAADLDTRVQTARLGLPARFVGIACVPLRWAVIGCGWVARDHVIPAFEHAPSAHLVALCDSDPDKLELCRPAYGPGPARHDDLHRLMASERIDAVYIATPNHAHADPCIAAALAGKDVFCEKPIAATLAHARDMLAACERAGVAFATAFDQRFHEAHHVLRAAVASGTLGRITQARIHYACQVDAGWRPGATDTDNWRLDRQRAGGGAVIDLAPHALDLLALVLDDEPCELDVKLQPRLVGDLDEVDAGGVLGVRFARGSLATIHVSYQCPEFLPRRELELIGTLGGARAIDTMGQTPGGRIEWHGPGGTDVQAFSTDSALSPFARQIEAFSAMRIQARSWPFPPARDLAHFELLMDALERAERAPSTMSVSPKHRPRTRYRGERR